MKTHFSNYETQRMYFEAFDDEHPIGWYELGYSNKDSFLGWGAEGYAEYIQDLRKADRFYRKEWSNTFLKEVNFKEIDTYINYK